nr:hypothetical protein [Tanacetum cinerariifolium]
SGVDVQYAKQLIKDAVDKARTELPNDLPTDPTVQEVNISEQPIMYVNLSGNLPASQLKKLADDFQDKIEALPEITRVDIVGALEQQVNVDVDLTKLQASQLSFTDIENAIARENITDRESYARLDGQPTVTLNVVKRQGENLLDASDKIHELVKESQASMPNGLKITITGDSSNETRNTLNDLINTIIIGFLL